MENNFFSALTKPFSPHEYDESDTADYNKNIDKLIQQNMDTTSGLLGHSSDNAMDEEMEQAYGPREIEQIYGPQNIRQEPPQRRGFGKLADIVRSWWNNKGEEPDFLGNAPMDKVNQRLGEPPVY